jgi:hypothetical protein
MAFTENPEPATRITSSPVVVAEKPAVSERFSVVGFTVLPEPPLPVLAALVVENNGQGPVSPEVEGTAGTYYVQVDVPGAPVEAYNGRPGSGGREVVFVDAGGGVIVPEDPIYLPPLPVGTYSLTLTPVAGGSAITTEENLTVLPETFDSRTLLLRRILPPWLATGLRNPSRKAFPQP